MPRFVSRDETETVRARWWGEREHAVIRRFGYGGRQKLVDAAVKAGLVAGEAGQEIALNQVAVGNMNLVILELGLVSWTDAEGARLPVTRAAIEALEEQDAEFLLGEINRLNTPEARSADEQASFRDGD
jgi:hypothetical protein